MAIPVEIIIGFPVLATLRIRGISVFSKLAILYAGTSNDSRKSTAVLSKGVLKTINPNSLQRLNIGSCHSHGV
ncbi:hypothetical protein D3C74_468830 [compost metagenome]